MQDYLLYSVLASLSCSSPGGRSSELKVELFTVFRPSQSELILFFEYTPALIFKIFIQTHLNEEASKRVGVIGSGDFGRALAGRLAQAGYSPTIGSRNPEQNRQDTTQPQGAETHSRIGRILSNHGEQKPRAEQVGYYPSLGSRFWNRIQNNPII